MRSWWTITQACTWIATKDERLVNVVSGEFLVEADITVSERTPLPDDDSSRPSNAPVSEALSNHPGGRSFKEAMQNLDLLLRKMADDYLHKTIGRRESLPNATQVDFAAPLDRLLGEIEGILGNRAEA